MEPLTTFGLSRWIGENRAAFEPPVGNKVMIWEDSQFTARVIRGPNARRDVHIDPSDENFFMLEGAMTLETLGDWLRGARTTWMVAASDPARLGSIGRGYVR